MSLSERKDAQIILNTHSPGIANLLPTESLRFLHKKNNKVFVEKGSDEILERIAESLGVLPSIDKEKIDKLKLIVCVEGPTDVEFLKRLGNIIDDDLRIDFENDQRVVIIPLGGSTLKHWVDNHYLRKLGLPEIHIYDGDKNENEIKAEQVTNRGDGSKGFVTTKREIENYVHPQILKEIFNLEDSEDIVDTSKTEWLNEWNQLDIPQKIKGLYHLKGWSIQQNKIKEKICTEGVEKMTIELFQELEAYGEIKTWFKSIKKVITG